MNIQELANSDNITEITYDFLKRVGYHSVKCWREWEDLAKEYGLPSEELAELKSHLEQNDQLIYQTRVDGSVYWFNHREHTHVQLLVQYLPDTWKLHLNELITARAVGDVDADIVLRKAMKQASIAESVERVKLQESVDLIAHKIRTYESDSFSASGSGVTKAQAVKMAKALVKNRILNELDGVELAELLKNLDDND